MNRPAHPPPNPEAVHAAKSAGLRYVHDDGPGVRRKRIGRAFRYQFDDGTAVHESRTLARIKRLAIPPAWTDVWICPFANGHIQASGRDDRHRKQYRYHEDWRAVRDQTKYTRMIAFGGALARIRRRVAHDLRRPGLGREKVLATVVRLLETTLIRVGNEEYAKANGSIGLSTMRDRHVRVRGDALHFAFRGKSGKYRQIELHDPRIARVVRQVQDLPGQELFQYIDDDGQRQKISSEDVNDYLRRTAGEEFSAKDFRTWAGTVLAASALAQLEPGRTRAQAKRNLVAAVNQVAARLGNTPAVCRKCYIHPIVFESYLRGETIELPPAGTTAVGAPGLSVLKATERTVRTFIRRQLARGAQPSLATALKRSLAAARPPAHPNGSEDGAPATATTRARRPPPSAVRWRRAKPTSPDRARR